MSDASAVIEVLEAATEENKLSALRHGNVIHLPEEGSVILTGDLHDHRTNFAKVLTAADLDNTPDRHLILHELLHGDHIDADGAEHSWKTLYAAAELKCDLPRQVHFVLANHDLAQIFGDGISKGGTDVCRAFNRGIEVDFGSEASTVQVVLTEFLLSLPLAIRCGEHWWMSHSLPTDEQIPLFDHSVFDREVTSADYLRRTGMAYQLIWGRRFTPEGVRQWLEKVGAKTVITGHQPQDAGYLINGPQHIILASDHNNGVLAHLELGRDYTSDEIAEQIHPLVAIEGRL